ncbi:hypothetical protein G6F40_017479 [Rhizopus arrhizus]|nr:hypothetical protein G6F24_015952 [Rhizopus arrhizus]KAG1073215.1 hypothetical protein G6F40_017479 [Rhizopus arrhizus]KAG1242325.1 hypothetical protein G6F68_016242 [Rhizopus microsporus]KAG1247216.1 hypothetical protein G6F65_020284 [Rhizopus arrhizus]
MADNQRRRLLLDDGSDARDPAAVAYLPGNPPAGRRRAEAAGTEAPGGADGAGQPARGRLQPGELLQR